MMIDGNRRWAKQLGYDSAAHGHRAGAAKMRDFLGWCDEIGVRVVSLYLLSTDNLRKRDTKELSDLIEIIAELAVELSHERDWRVHHMGRAHLLPPDLARVLAVSQRPLAAVAFAQPASVAAWKTKPAWGVVASSDTVINPDVERFGYERAGMKVSEIDSSHLLMLSHPKEVVEVIREALASVTD